MPPKHDVGSAQRRRRAVHLYVLHRWISWEVSFIAFGAYLSGGLDSTAIVAMMMGVAPERRPTCFTIDFAANGNLDDSPQDLLCTRRIARRLGVNLIEVQMELSAILRRSMVEDTLAPDALRRRSFFNPAAVRRLVDQNREGEVDGSYTIFVLMCVELWCRHFVDA